MDAGEELRVDDVRYAVLVFRRLNYDFAQAQNRRLSPAGCSGSGGLGTGRRDWSVELS